MRNSCSAAQNFETCLGTYRRPLRPAEPPPFSTILKLVLASNHWFERLRVTKNFWPDQNFLTEKIMKISKFYFGPGSPKNRFLRFFRNFFTKNGPGMESRVRRPGASSETPWSREWLCNLPAGAHCRKTYSAPGRLTRGSRSSHSRFPGFRPFFS